MKAQGGKTGKIRGTNLYTVHFRSGEPTEEPMTQSEYFAERWKEDL